MLWACTAYHTIYPTNDQFRISNYLYRDCLSFLGVPMDYLGRHIGFVNFAGDLFEEVFVPIGAKMAPTASRSK